MEEKNIILEERIESPEDEVNFARRLLELQVGGGDHKLGCELKSRGSKAEKFDWKIDNIKPVKCGDVEIWRYKATLVLCTDLGRAKEEWDRIGLEYMDLKVYKPE